MTWLGLIVILSTAGCSESQIRGKSDRSADEILDFQGESNYTVRDSAEVRATFLPIDFFEGLSASGTVVLFGDLEYRVDRSNGAFTGFVDRSTASLGSINDVITPPPYSWRD